MNNTAEYYRTHPHSCGLLPSYGDPNSVDYRSIISGTGIDNDMTYPATFMLWDSPIKDQQTKPTCAAHAMASAMEILEYYDTGSKEQFSTSWYYGYRLTNITGEGMVTEDLLKMAKQIGGVYKKLMPDNLTFKESRTLIENMKDKCLEESKMHRIKEWIQIKNVWKKKDNDILIKDIKRALYVDHSPIMCSCWLYSSFYKTNSTGIIAIPDRTVEKTVDNHCMLCVGWKTIGDEEYIIIKNSWGETWGDNGYGYIPLKDTFMAYNMYSFIDMQNYPVNITDISGRWSEDYVNKVIRSGILSGYEDGTFKPTNKLTREEMAVIVCKILDKLGY